MSGFLKIIVAVSLIVLMMIAFWIVRYQPKQNEIASLNADIEKQTAQYLELQSESKNLEQWEQAKIRFEQVLGQLHQTAVPMKAFIPSFLKDIERLVDTESRTAADPGFRVTTITPGSVQSGVSSGAGAPGSSAPAGLEGGSTTVQLNFTGRFNTIIDFLQQLSNLKLNKIVTIQQISLSPGSTSAGGSPTLNVTMPFQLYMLGGH